jgi:hypothetical protein
VLHNTRRLRPVGGYCPIAAGREVVHMSPELAELALTAVKLGMMAVVLVVLALALT